MRTLFDCLDDEGSVKPSAQSAREHHSRKDAQRAALRLLRAGKGLTKLVWESMHPGSRIAPTVEQLRNAHGFTIHGDGSCDAPYFMSDLLQLPTLVEVTREMQDAYYAHNHWRRVREARFSHDGLRCVLCRACENLQCHHVIYRLFHEKLSDLKTVCPPCHQKCHQQARLKFPSGMRVEYARMLVEVRFDEWLLPGGQG